MTKSTPTLLDSQAPFERFVFALLAQGVAQQSPPIAGAAVEAALLALGGGKRARAAVQAMATALAFLDTELPATASILDEEDLATAATHRVVCPVLTERIQRKIKGIEAESVGAHICSVGGCGARAHSRGRADLTLIGRHGKMLLNVRQVECTDPACGHMYSPAFKVLGLDDGRFTPGCSEAVSMMATTVPHGKAQGLLADLLQIESSEHAIQDLVEKRGEVLLARDLAEAASHDPEDATGLARSCGRPADAVAATEAPEVAYLEMDGVLPMVRELLPKQSTEVPGARGGKGRKYNVEGAEVKNGVLYNAKAQAQEMPSRGCLLDRNYVSFLGHWKPFALLLWLAMLRLRYDQAKLLVILGDGAEWIRSFAAWLPMQGRILLILDFFHAVHRAWEVARALYGDGTEKCRERAQLWREVIELGEVRLVIQELKEIKDSREAVQKKVNELITYFENNMDRMNYPDYKARGLRYTSGIVESANFHVTGARLKQQGMRWSKKGASELAFLRADLCNGRWASRSRSLLAA